MDLAVVAAVAAVAAAAVPAVAARTTAVAGGGVRVDVAAAETDAWCSVAPCDTRDARALDCPVCYPVPVGKREGPSLRFGRCWRERDVQKFHEVANADLFFFCVCPPLRRKRNGPVIRVLHQLQWDTI